MHWKEVPDDQKEQYTGLKDKNGVKIFEGDIVDLGIRNRPYIVEWTNRNCMFFPFGKEEIMMEVHNKNMGIEVIGNRHTGESDGN